MKRILSIIAVTTIIFLIGFVFLRVENEDFAATLLDDTGLNSARIRKNKESMSGSVATGAILTGDTMSGSLFSGNLLTGTTITGTVDTTGSTTTGN